MGSTLNCLRPGLSSLSLLFLLLLPIIEAVLLLKNCKHALQNHMTVCKLLSVQPGLSRQVDLPLILESNAQDVVVLRVREERRHLLDGVAVDGAGGPYAVVTPAAHGLLGAVEVVQLYSCASTTANQHVPALSPLLQSKKIRQRKKTGKNACVICEI